MVHDGSGMMFWLKSDTKWLSFLEDSQPSEDGLFHLPGRRLLAGREHHHGYL